MIKSDDQIRRQSKDERKMASHQIGFAQQLGALDQVADGHVEVTVATAPVRYFRKWIGSEDILSININQY